MNRRREAAALLLILPLVLSWGWFNSVKKQMETGVWHQKSWSSKTQSWQYSGYWKHKFVDGDCVGNGAVWATYRFVDKNHIRFQRAGEQTIYLRVSIVEIGNELQMQWIFEGRSEPRVFLTFGREK